MTPEDIEARKAALDRPERLLAVVGGVVGGVVTALIAIAVELRQTRRP